jgi:hypothetical protein
VAHGTTASAPQARHLGMTSSDMSSSGENAEPSMRRATTTSSS